MVLHFHVGARVEHTDVDGSALASILYIQAMWRDTVESGNPVIFPLIPQFVIITSNKLK